MTAQPASPSPAALPRRIFLYLPSALLLLLGTMALLVTYGCGDHDPHSMGICERCNTDVDCKEGLTCELYGNSSLLVMYCTDGRAECAPVSGPPSATMLMAPVSH
ncbi:MAG: hypothetical protein HZB25_02825 [Candidatus Eisenbacteria bacterium]|nr:hypothetical protein [Candidatus Eisenbacteria bacterium]